jgi:hypothetical protein
MQPFLISLVVDLVSSACLITDVFRLLLVLISFNLVLHVRHVKKLLETRNNKISLVLESRN